MNKYRAEFFSCVEWDWSRAEILAISKEQARELIDKKCKPEFRMKSYHDEIRDTLKLTLIEENLQLPLIFKEYY